MEIQKKDEDDIWSEAEKNAIEAFKNTFSEYDLDPAYWCLAIVSRKMDAELSNVLETRTWDEYGSYDLS